MKNQKTLSALIDEAKGDTLVWVLATALGYTTYENAVLNGQPHKGVWLSPPPPGDPNKWLELSSLSIQSLCDKHSIWELIARYKINLICCDGRNNWTASSPERWSIGDRPEEAFARCFAKLRLTDEAAYIQSSIQPSSHLVGAQKAGEPAIEAKLISDDKVFVATFDAEEYFKQASTESLRELVECGFGGDYPADEVAEFFQGKNADVDAVFDYVARISDLPSKKNVSGFECYVDGDHAVSWLKKNRPAALSSLPEDDWRISLRKGDQVYWKDPDGDISSGHYRIAGINDDNEVVSQEDTLLILTNDEGSLSEVFASEILQSKPSKRMRP